MSPAERAKQFMPFAALKGYEEALREKENTGIYPIERSLKNDIIYTYEYQIYETNE